MTLGADAIALPRALRVLAIVALLGAIGLGGWLAWCAAYQFAGISTEAEVVSTRIEHHSHKGKKYQEAYGLVRYTDEAGQVHTNELRLYGGAAVGRKIIVRYLPVRPDACRLDDFWGIWGLAVMSSGFFALFIGLTWYVERRRRPIDPRRNPFDQTSS